MGCPHFYEWEDCPSCNPEGTRSNMSVKTNKVSRWEVILEASAIDIPLVVNSIDGDDKNIKVRLGNTERTVSVADWVAFANAVTSNVNYVATR